MADLEKFIIEHVPGYRHMLRLQGDASARVYYRVFCDEGTYILCEDPGFRGTAKEDYPAVIVYRLIYDRVPVPEIIAADNELGLFLLEDAGDGLVERIIPLMETGETVTLYKKIIDHGIEIQRTENDSSLPFTLSFNMEKLMFEFNFFIEHCLMPMSEDLTEKDRCLLVSEFDKISRLMQRPEHFVLNHRDFHSRNIIIRDGRSFVIDYQDARLGLPQYDAVSLLRDCYTVFDDDLFFPLKNYWSDSARDAGILSMGSDEFDFLFDISAFQRNVKALGTFGFQVIKRGNESFAPYLKTGYAYLDGYASRQKELRLAKTIIGNYLENELRVSA